MMKKIFLLLGVFMLGLFFFCSTKAFAAPDMSGKNYRSRWEEAEMKYKGEDKERKAQERKQLYTRVYFELGKEYYTLEDYAAALVSFRRVIDLEQNLEQKEYTPMAEEYLKEVEKRLPRQIETQYSVSYGKDLGRLKKGIDFILAQKPEVQPPEEPEMPAEEAIEESAPESAVEEAELSVDTAGQETVVVMIPADIQDPKMQRIHALRQQVGETQEDLEKDRELMRLALQKEVLQSKKEIEKLIYEQKIRQVGNRAEVENRLMTLKELYGSGDYANALPEAKMILELDPTNRFAKRVKEIIETKNRKEREEKIRKAKQEMWRKQTIQERARLKQERQEALRRQKELAEAARKEKEQARLRREEEKQAKAEAARQKELALQIEADLEEAQEYILREDYTRATSRIKEVLQIDPNHPEALRLKDYIELRLQGITQQLQTY
ncbi:MAG: hypothetical protein JXD21_02125 [Candidatus Omnitrophica bacterium]|nr:hypothetical protein [Candidatus Omnitrophota bacterium]